MKYSVDKLKTACYHIYNHIVVYLKGDFTMVKNLIFGVLSTVLVAGTTTPKCIAENGSVELNRAYASIMMVTDVIELEDETYLLELEDATGNVWEYETDMDDMFIDDAVAVLMDNMGTVEIYDDEVIGLNYSSWTLTK